MLYPLAMWFHSRWGVHCHSRGDWWLWDGTQKTWQAAMEGAVWAQHGLGWPWFSNRKSFGSALFKWKESIQEDANMWWGCVPFLHWDIYLTLCHFVKLNPWISSDLFCNPMSVSWISSSSWEAGGLSCTDWKQEDRALVIVLSAPIWLYYYITEGMSMLCPWRGFSSIVSSHHDNLVTSKQSQTCWKELCECTSIWRLLHQYHVTLKCCSQGFLLLNL